MKLEITIMIECEGTYRKGTASRFNTEFGNFLPGDPEEIEGFRVFIRNGKERIEITEALMPFQLDLLYESYLEEQRGG